MKSCKNGSERSKRWKEHRKIRLLNIQDDRCYLCGCSITFDTATIDHFFPKSKGGGNSMENMFVSCMPCNSHKSDNIFETPDEARRFIQQKRGYIFYR